MATAPDSPLPKDDPFDSTNVRVTVTGWPKCEPDICPMTRDNLGDLLTCLQKNMVNYVVTLRAPIDTATSGDFFCVTAPRRTNSDKIDNIRRPTIMLDVLVWEDLSPGKRHNFLTSIKKAFDQFLSKCKKSPQVFYLITLDQAPNVKGSAFHHTNAMFSLPGTMNGYGYSLSSHSKSTDV